MYETPQTRDGWVREAQALGGGAHRIEVVVPVEPAFRDRVRGRESEVIFAARSRLARLGLNVMPVAEPVWDGDEVGLVAEVRATVKAYDLERHLPRLLRPGLPVGRLVFCPADRRLSSEQIFEAVRSNAFQLPAEYSIDGDGRFRIRARGHVYDLQAPLTLEDLVTIAVRADGKDLLNRAQVRRAVDHVELLPGDGVITSCAMFLHRHYVVLDPEAGPLGKHLEAVVLDPISTRGANVYLEFVNNTATRIVNPAVKAEIYEAIPIESKPRRWYGTGVTLPVAPEDGEPRLEHEYELLASIFDRLEAAPDERWYSHRMVAIVDDPRDLLGRGEPARLWRAPADPQHRPLLDVSSRLREGVEVAGERERGTSLLRDIEPGAKATVLLGFFPNLVEHLEICAAGLQGKIGRILFRRASYEHGSFLSARDHGRLADYEGLGIDVFWCHDERRHVVRHVFRGLRGFFVEPHEVERFKTSLILAAYGSSRPIAPEQLERIQYLIERLRDFFGDDLAIITGGGPGSMQQATDFAQSLGLLVGASFIETVDQQTNRTANFYQTFQGRSRQARQRWFEVASFHLFFMGGVGTLEEVGLTFTDMKLGVIELSPLVFFGRHDGEVYWGHLRQQLEVMIRAGRAPAWLRTHTLMTDEPEDVPRFYKRMLELG